MKDHPTRSVKDAGDLPDPTPADARQAVIDAARKDGVTCQRGAYTGRRTYAPLTGDVLASKPSNAVLLKLRTGYGGDIVGVYPVTQFFELRDDWSRPSPADHDIGDEVLPADEFDLDDIFVDPAALPGDTDG